MNSVQNKQRNPTIDVFRLICAVLVVAIHTSPFSELGTGAEYLFREIVPRIAVPFFFATAGYFYIGKLERGDRCFFPYIKKTLLIYGLWSIPYFIQSFLEWGHLNPAAFVVECAYSFLVIGSSYHFWFFPALIVCVCVTTAAYRLRIQRFLLPVGILLYVTGCFGCSYHAIGARIPLLKALYLSGSFTLIRRILMMGLTFFLCGHHARMLQARIKRPFAGRFAWSVIAVFVLLWLVEIGVVLAAKWQRTIVITLFLYPLLLVTLLYLLQNPKPHLEPYAPRCRAAANFMYYAHPLYLTIMLIAADTAGISISPTIQFLLTVFLTACSSQLIRRSDNRFLRLLIS